MANEKLTISWDDLNAPKVEESIKQQEVLRQTREHYETAPDPKALLRQPSGFWYNTIVYTTLFGLLGGMVGWAAGEVMHLRPNLRAEARELLDSREKVLAESRAGMISKSEADLAITNLRFTSRDNPYYLIYDDDSLSASQKQADFEQLDAQERMRALIADVLFYGMCGMMISLCLAVADPIMERNVPSAMINGSVGAILGLLGGVVLALVIDQIYERVLGKGIVVTDALERRLIARALSWSVLGSFLGMAPGVAMRNLKRFALGAGGGLVGGAIGGLLCEGIMHFSDTPHTARLMGIVSIGVFSGLTTGLFENVAKTGWIKVTAGVITGKQFVLYRNPTYFGSSPSCQIYLFRDPQIGKRHAAIHIIPGGFELENLPLGGVTLLNRKPVNRARLHNGDQLQIGSFSFVFQQKAQSTDV